MIPVTQVLSGEALLRADAETNTAMKDERNLLAQIQACRAEGAEAEGRVILLWGFSTGAGPGGFWRIEARDTSGCPQ